MARASSQSSSARRRCAGWPRTSASRASLSDVLLAARYLVGCAIPAELHSAAFLASAPFARLRLDAGAASQVLESATEEIASLRAALAD